MLHKFMIYVTLVTIIYMDLSQINLFTGVNKTTDGRIFKSVCDRFAVSFLSVCDRFVEFFLSVCDRFTWIFKSVFYRFDVMLKVALPGTVYC